MMNCRAEPAAMRIIQLILLLTAALLCLAAWVFLRAYPLLLSLISGAVIITALLCGFLLFPLWLCSVRCIVSDGQITVRSGIFLKRECSVTLQSVQFAEVIRGPRDGEGGMNFIVLHVCGGRLVMPFLRRQDRGEIVEFLRMKGVFHAP